MKKAKYKRVTQKMMELVKTIDYQMDENNKGISQKNKAIKDITGIKSSGTIKLMRESGYNLEKHKILSRQRYPQAYKTSPKNTNAKTIPLFYDDDSPYSKSVEDSIYNYLEEYFKSTNGIFENSIFGRKTIIFRKIKILNNLISIYLTAPFNNEPKKEK